MNNTMVFDHHWMFIYFDTGSFHVWTSYMNSICTKLASIFCNTNDYFEYLLNDLSSMGEEMFVMWHLKRCELTFGHDLNVMHAYNKMHIGYKMWMEWGIGGLKQKWKRFMKCFDSTMPKSNHLFKIVTILTNFFHKHHLHFTYEVIGAT